MRVSEVNGKISQRRAGQKRYDKLMEPYSSCFCSYLDINCHYIAVGATLDGYGYSGDSAYRKQVPRRNDRERRIDKYGLPVSCLFDGKS